MAVLEEYSAGERFDSVVMDRDRFVAFSFCTADLLIELDADKKISFTAGATKPMLGRGPEELVGKSMSSMVAAVDRIMADETLTKMRDYGALEEVLIRLRTAKGPTEKLAMSGYFLDELGGRLYITLRRKVTKAIIVKESDVDRDAESGLLKAASFVDVASEKLEELGDQYQMSTLELDGGDQ
ncbi:MAG: PAS domain-containing protein, partial [Pseudomonadota bacterium]